MDFSLRTLEPKKTCLGVFSCSCWLGLSLRKHWPMLGVTYKVVPERPWRSGSRGRQRSLIPKWRGFDSRVVRIIFFLSGIRWLANKGSRHCKNAFCMKVQEILGAPSIGEHSAYCVVRVKSVQGIGRCAGWLRSRGFKSRRSHFFFKTACLPTYKCEVLAPWKHRMKTIVLSVV